MNLNISIMGAETFPIRTDGGEIGARFFEPGGILFRELELLDNHDIAFETARYIAQIPKDELKKVVPMIEGLDDNTFAMRDGQGFVSLNGREIDEENPQFKTYVRVILENWTTVLLPQEGIIFSADEIEEFTQGLGFKQEAAFRLYRIRKFSALSSSEGISYTEMKKSPRWKEISRGLDHGGVLSLVALHFISE